MVRCWHEVCLFGGGKSIICELFSKIYNLLTNKPPLTLSSSGIIEICILHHVHHVVTYILKDGCLRKSL